MLDELRARRAAIRKLKRAPTETVLARLCADVIALMFPLRVAGGLMDPAALERHDKS